MESYSNIEKIKTIGSTYMAAAGLTSAKVKSTSLGSASASTNSCLSSSSSAGDISCREAVDGNYSVGGGGGEEGKSGANSNNKGEIIADLFESRKVESKNSTASQNSKNKRSTMKQPRKESVLELPVVNSMKKPKPSILVQSAATKAENEVM